MEKPVVLKFRDEKQAKFFADACQYFLDDYGPFPLDQVIIYSVISNSRNRRERDRLRQDYAMLLQAFNDNVSKLQQAKGQIERLKSGHYQKR